MPSAGDAKSGSGRGQRAQHAGGQGRPMARPDEGLLQRPEGPGGTASCWGESWGPEARAGTAGHPRQAWSFSPLGQEERHEWSAASSGAATGA